VQDGTDGDRAIDFLNDNDYHLIIDNAKTTFAMSSTLIAAAPLLRQMPVLDSRRAAEPAERPATLVESTDLLRGQKTVGILHNGSLYRLQATKLGKLILTK
jgi:hemin uptake protein HemP